MFITIITKIHNFCFSINVLNGLKQHVIGTLVVEGMWW